MLVKYVVLSGKHSGYLTDGFVGQGCFGKVVKSIKLNMKKKIAVEDFTEMNA